MPQINEDSYKQAHKSTTLWLYILLTLCVAGITYYTLHSLIQHKTKDYSRYSIIELREAGWPEELLEMAQRYPETIDFVRHYKEKHIDPSEIDISTDLDVRTIPLFIQWDERWGYESYGNNFLGITGCGPTSLSMVYCGLTGKTDLNPYVMAKIAEEKGYYVRGSGSKWSIMDTLAQELGLSLEPVSLSRDSVLNALSAAHPVICIVGPGDFTTSGHFIVLCEIAPDGHIVVNDPNSLRNSHQTWDLDQILSQTNNLWSYSYRP